MPELQAFAHDALAAMRIVGVGALAAMLAWILYCGLSGKLGART